MRIRLLELFGMPGFVPFDENADSSTNIEKRLTIQRDEERRRAEAFIDQA